MLIRIAIVTTLVVVLIGVGLLVYDGISDANDPDVLLIDGDASSKGQVVHDLGRGSDGKCLSTEAAMEISFEVDVDDGPKEVTVSRNDDCQIVVDDIVVEPKPKRDDSSFVIPAGQSGQGGTQASQASTDWEAWARSRQYGYYVEKGMMH